MTTLTLLLAFSLFFPSDAPTDVCRADFGISLIVSLLIAAASIVLSEVLRPDQDIENARPAAEGDFTFPTAIEGRPQPLLWGTCKLEGPNVIWWGDLRQVPITEEVQTGLWSSQEYIKGYRYYVGVQFGLCRGQVDAIKKIWIGDKELWSGTVQDGAINVTSAGFFGGVNYGNGGVVGTLRMYSGSKTQAANSYLTTHQGVGIGYRGMAYAVWEGGWLGNSTAIKPWKFELQRFPNGLGMSDNKHIVNTYDSNPMCVAYEIMTDADWGLGLPVGDIDTSTMISVGNTLYTEGNGFSMILDKAMSAGELLAEIERQIDGVIYLDQVSGKWTVTLARGGYDIDSVPQISRADGDVVRLKNWDPGTWESLVNEVHVQFVDRQRDYQSTFAKGDNSAAITSQGRVEPTTVKYPGVKNAALARQIACREIRTLSRPLGKLTLETTREFWDMNPGDVFAWTDGVIGHTKLGMRVTRVDLGTLEQGVITVTAVQDVFSYHSGFNGAPPEPEWELPTQDVEEIPANRHVVIEAPYAFVRRDPAYPGTLDRLWAGGRREDAGAVAMNLYERNASGTPSGDYSLAGSVGQFFLIGKLKAAVGEEDPNPSTTDLQLEADDDTHADLLAAFTNTTGGNVGQNLANLILVGSEFMGVTSVTDQTTYIELESVYRGMLDTVPADHAIGDKVYLLFVGGNLSTSTIPQTNNVHAQLRQVSRDDETTEGEAVQKSLTMANRCRRPYPPVEMDINGSRYPSSPTWDDLKTGGSTLDERGFEVEYLRRNWRTYDEVSGLTTDAGTLDSSFPTQDSTEYRAEAVDDPGGSPTSMQVTSWNSGGTSLFLSRTKMLRSMSGSIPTTVRIDVETHHDYEGTTYTATQELSYTFSMGSSVLDDDHNWGNVPYGTVSGTWTAPVTGTYTFNIGTSMPSGNVQARINGGSWQNVILAGNLTGTLAGVTASDTIEVQHLSNTGTSTETFCESLAPSGTAHAYAIMIY